MNFCFWLGEGEEGSRDLNSNYNEDEAMKKDLPRHTVVLLPLLPWAEEHGVGQRHVGTVPAVSCQPPIHDGQLPGLLGDPRFAVALPFDLTFISAVGIGHFLCQIVLLLSFLLLLEGGGLLLVGAAAAAAAVRQEGLLRRAHPGGRCVRRMDNPQQHSHRVPLENPQITSLPDKFLPNSDPSDLLPNHPKLLGPVAPPVRVKTLVPTVCHLGKEKVMLWEYGPANHV